jgi:hypothetical protein
MSFIAGGESIWDTSKMMSNKIQLGIQLSWVLTRFTDFQCVLAGGPQPLGHYGPHNHYLSSPHLHPFKYYVIGKLIIPGVLLAHTAHTGEL